jgi:hypothetical protein
VFGALIKLRSNDLYKDVFVTNQITKDLANGFKWLEVNTDSSKICVIGNFDVVPQTANVTFQETGTWYDYLNGTTIDATGTAQSITLQPGEYHVYLNRNVTDNITTPVTSISPGVNGLFVDVYPDPFQQNTTIDLTVPETGKVQVDLVNMMGQGIQKIYSGVLLKGAHTLDFNNDGRLPRGVYLIKVNTKTSVKTIKIVLNN